MRLEENSKRGFGDPGEDRESFSPVRFLHPASLFFILGCLVSSSVIWGMGKTRGTTEDVQPHVISASVYGEQPVYGFTPFPYDYTLEAINQTQSKIVDHSSLYALHFDNGIPWAEALADTPFPQKLQDKWDDLVKKLPSKCAIYLGLAPLGHDRTNLAPACEGSSLPSSLSGARLDSEDVKKAYLNYARRAVEKFHPRFLNLGIESGQMAARDPSRWPQFEALYNYVRSEIKKTNPSISIGISFGLQALMDESVAERARPLVNNSDYLGLSFYPYASAFAEKFGAPPLPEGRNAWREPLIWAHQYTDKPVAVCETGFTTENISLPTYDLNLYGDPETQTAYVEDLMILSKHHKYLFVVWYLLIDYDKLYAKMPPGSEVNLLWKNIGLFDGDVNPKPAWQAWLNGIASEVGEDDPEWTSSESEQPKIEDSENEEVKVSSVQSKPQVVTKPVAEVKRSSQAISIGFSQSKDLFVGPPGDRLSFVAEDGENPSSMQWDYNYDGKAWHWCIKEFKPGLLKGTEGLSFKIKSKSKITLFLQLEEKKGEPFFVMVEAEPEWKTLSLKLDQFTVDAKKKKDGKLDIEAVAKIMLADPSGRNKKKGDQTIWIADWFFE